MTTHLWLDGIAGLVLLLSPWLFAFATIIAWPHVVVGLLVLLIAVTTQTVPAEKRAPAHASDRPPGR